MKKQIFILVLTVLASIASIHKSYGQACLTASRNNPAVGDTYNYAVTIGTGFGGGDYKWYITKDTELVGASEIASGTAAAGVFTSNLANADNIDIVWNAASLGNTYFVVVKYTETKDGCDVENMKTWKVVPINKFLLAINSFSGTLGQDGSYCPAPVSSADVSGTAAVYKYGVNTMYAEITASNFAGDWTPSFKITGLDGVQTIQNVSWGTSPANAGDNALTSAGSGVYNAGGNATAAYDGSLKIYLKFEIVNNTFETLSPETISIAVDGVIAGTTTKDVKSDTDCSIEDDFGKTHNQTIKARPAITTTTPSLY